ncbi:MAG: hypothetical protein HOQ06_04925 [Pseudarthrobacter sp.]|nr:hypothetical protein [Pseudarthrobacter sp.]
METTPPPEPRPSPVKDVRDEPGPPKGGTPANKGSTSLVLAILAPVSMFLTGPFAGLAMLLTYSDSGYSPAPWAAPLVLFSLPLLFAVLALRLALPALRGSPRNSGNWSAAAVSLCICGLVFVLALGPALNLTGLF